MSCVIKLLEQTVREQLQQGRTCMLTPPPFTSTDPICCATPPGIGSGSAPLQQCIELAQRPRVLQHWTSCQHLIIDEVSMVEAQFFDKLESVAR